ncbi:MAG: glycosyl transferase family 90 [Rickettsiaceae bacterium]|nr:glycosyl transferase family 90 [Rickettsiaceae bacterium]
MLSRLSIMISLGAIILITIFYIFFYINDVKRQKLYKFISNPYSIIRLYRAKSLHTQNLKNLARQLSEAPSAWTTANLVNSNFSISDIKDSIIADKLTLTEQFLDTNNIKYCRIKILNEAIYYKLNNQDAESLSRAKKFLEALKLIIQNIDIKNLDFILSTEDSVDLALPPNIAPIFVFAASKDNIKNKLLVPDALTLYNYNNIYYESMANNKLWSDKINKLVWRGASTGWIIDNSDNTRTSHMTLKNYHLFPRLRLVEYSLKRSDLIDAKFVQLVQMDKELQEVLSRKNIIGSYMTYEEQMNFRYQITMDGNSATYPGFLWRLMSNSLNFKEDSPEVQWFYPLLEPMVHYIPISRDLNDLPQKLDWAENNQTKASLIALNAALLVREKIKPNDLYLYLFLILKEYSNYIGFVVDFDGDYKKF